MADHDKAYKRLFSHAPVVADLIHGFVREEWVQELDLSTLEPFNGSYVSDDLRDRESDLVWRVRWGGEEWVYVYLLLEFQSTVDSSMALRVMTYLGLLYQDLYRRKLLTPSGRLPPVLSIVLYNGYRPWGAALDISDLVEPVPGGLERYRPSVRYILLDELRLAESELPSVRNLAAAVFRLEQARGPAEYRELKSALALWLREPEHEELRRSFETWIGRVLLPSRLAAKRLTESEIKEIQSMLTPEEEEFGIDWSRDWVRQGRREAMEEALRAMRRSVLALLGQRFGPPSEEVRRRVEGIGSLDELTSILERILTVRSLAELGLEPTA
ncbi:MAG TPA: Rpn family recombination-promoting nuclease/putative transposase [Thermoanaerobaculia bacterium]|nr:Rpn family recombination-promoting nuclease/putative transposase [Thermoanaerobaculia bacterium]